jgi:hypothetical protein
LDADPGSASIPATKRGITVVGEIEIVENISREDFKKLYFDTKTPVVIKGLQANAPVVKASTIDGAIKMFGDQQFEVVEEYVSKFQRDDSFIQNANIWSMGKYLRTVEKDKYTIYCVRAARLHQIYSWRTRTIRRKCILMATTGTCCFTRFSGENESSWSIPTKPKSLIRC